MAARVAVAVIAFAGFVVARGLGGAPREAATATPSDPEAVAALGAARKAADGLATELRSLLVDELRTGGPAAAVIACASSAQERTAQYREKTGIDIRRVSLRHRNPTNAPDALEATVLESFDRLPVERRAGAEHWEIASESGRRSLRYLRPLVANAMCLNCHGPREGLSEAVRSSLASRYPDDRATGHAPGDVRGAISVRVPMPSRPQ